MESPLQGRSSSLRVFRLCRLSRGRACPNNRYNRRRCVCLHVLCHRSGAILKKSCFTGPDCSAPVRCGHRLSLRHLQVMETCTGVPTAGTATHPLASAFASQTSVTHCGRQRGAQLLGGLVGASSCFAPKPLSLPPPDTLVFRGPGASMFSPRIHG